MFLSRMALDLTRNDTYPFLHSPLLQREMIQSAFSENNQHFLWRTDFIDGRFWLVTLSQYRPTLNELHSLCGFDGVFPSWEIIDYDSTLDDAVTNSIHSFSLCASPAGKTIRPRSLYIEHQSLYYWLTEHSDEWGFKLHSLSEITGEWKVVSGHYILFGRWSGQLIITDDSLFRAASCNGIAKNLDLGAGLLTIDHVEEGSYRNF